jgi:hypothetical protein
VAWEKTPALGVTLAGVALLANLPFPSYPTGFAPVSLLVCLRRVEVWALLVWQVQLVWMVWIVQMVHMVRLVC